MENLMQMLQEMKAANEAAAAKAAEAQAATGRRFDELQERVDGQIKALGDARVVPPSAESVWENRPGRRGEGVEAGEHMPGCGGFEGGSFVCRCREAATRVGSVDGYTNASTTPSCRTVAEVCAVLNADVELTLAFNAQLFHGITTASKLLPRTVIALVPIGGRVAPPRASSAAQVFPCVRAGCPCTSSYNGQRGKFCCDTCRDGQACLEDYHDKPSRARRRGAPAPAAGAAPSPAVAAAVVALVAAGQTGDAVRLAQQFGELPTGAKAEPRRATPDARHRQHAAVGMVDEVSAQEGHSSLTSPIGAARGAGATESVAQLSEAEVRQVTESLNVHVRPSPAERKAHQPHVFGANAYGKGMLTPASRGDMMGWWEMERDEALGLGADPKSTDQHDSIRMEELVSLLLRCPPDQVFEYGLAGLEPKDIMTMLSDTQFIGNVKVDGQRVGKGWTLFARLARYLLGTDEHLAIGTTEARRRALFDLNAVHVRHRELVRVAFSLRRWRSHSTAHYSSSVAILLQKYMMMERESEEQELCSLLHATVSTIAMGGAANATIRAKRYLLAHWLIRIQTTLGACANQPVMFVASPQSELLACVAGAKGKQGRSATDTRTPLAAMLDKMIAGKTPTA